MESLAELLRELSGFHFLRPWWLLALAPLAILLYRLWRGGLVDRNWQEVCDAALLPFILQRSPGTRGRRALLLLALCGLLLVLALAGPAWQRLPTPVQRAASALVIVVDLSRSMDAGDVRPSRLERARYKITDLLRLRREGQTALVIYAADAFTVAPLSDDVRTITAQLPALATDLPPTQGKAPGAGLARAARLLARGGVQRGHVLLVTDAAAPGARRGVQSLAAAGHRVSVLAAGTRDGAPIALPEGGFLKDEQGAIVFPKTDHRALRALAGAGGGRYAVLRQDDSDVQALHAFFSRAPAVEEVDPGLILQPDTWQDQGHWLALLALPLAALGFRRGLLWVLCPLLLLPWSPPASAAGWQDLWKNRDQRALQRFHDGEYGAAAGQFSDPRWQAAAHYRDRNYEQSLQSLGEPVTAGDWYNYGNALARLGRYQDALSAYQQGLALDPGHRDAAHNRDVVEDALRRQQQAQEQGQEGREGQEGQEQESETGEQQQAGQGQESETGQQQEQGQGGEDAGSALAQEQPAGAAEQQQAEQQQGQAAAQEQAGDAGEGEQARAGSGAQDEPPSDQEQALAGGETQTGGESAPDDLRPGPGQQQQQQQESDALSVMQQEQRLATEQWLRRIPDDPGALLRRKFRYQEQSRRR